MALKSGAAEHSSVPANNTPLILSLETATRAGSVTLARGSHVIASRSGDAQTSHSNNLLHQVESVLKEACLRLSDIELFAVATGPGSFTGLRIGLATVKALAATLERPCAGVPTLHAVAHAAGASERTLALLPAGRGELFAQSFDVDDNGTVQALDEAAHLTPQRLLEINGKQRFLKWAGEGAHLHAEAIRQLASHNSITFRDEAREGRAPLISQGAIWTLAPPTEVLAEDVAALALKNFNAGEAKGPEELRAIYVRPSDAELMEQCREQKPTLK